MLPLRNLLKLVRTQKHASALCSSSAFQGEVDGVQPLGDQRAYYKVDLRKKSRSGNDSFFDVRDYERNDGGSALKGFGSNSYRRDNFQRDNYQRNNYDRPQVSGFGGRSRVYGAGAGLKPVNYRDTPNLAPVNRDFYRVHADVESRSRAEVDAFLAEHDMTLEGNDLPRPVFTFEEANFYPEIVSLLSSHYARPTPIQGISWPVALSGRDMISIARTGSGKTLGFLLPGIVHTKMQPPRAHGEGPSVLVLLPTRELAQQVGKVAKDYCKATGLSLTCCFGGASKIPQANELRRGVDVVVATPGRLLDFIESGSISLRNCTYLVLDEADRMLDMGFEPQIRKIVAQIRPERQTLMFSATWPKEVRALASDFQSEPVFLNVGSLELSANHNIQQHIEVIDEYSKQARLFQLLDHIMKQSENKTLIFVETKRKADELTRGMRRDGWPALCIHGDKSQSERDWVLNEFRNGKTPILLATDVAARGLDVHDIKYVINYDYPNNSEDYVHRIGRTGRGDQTGTSYTFFTPNNAPKARDLIKLLEEAKQNIPQELAQLSNSSSGDFSRNNGSVRGGGRGGGGFKRDSSSSGQAKRGRYRGGGGDGYGSLW